MHRITMMTWTLALALATNASAADELLPLPKTVKEEAKTPDRKDSKDTKDEEEPDKEKEKEKENLPVAIVRCTSVPPVIVVAPYPYIYPSYAHMGQWTPDPHAFQNYSPLVEPPVYLAPKHRFWHGHK